MKTKPPYPPREGDLPRDELCARAQQVLDEAELDPHSMWHGYNVEVLFKFTCQHCGERCTLAEPNRLYENGECFACGQTTKIDFGGYTLKGTIKPPK